MNFRLLFQPNPLLPRGDEMSYLSERFERLMDHVLGRDQPSPLREALQSRAWRLSAEQRLIIRQIYGPRFALWQGALAVI